MQFGQGRSVSDVTIQPAPDGLIYFGTKLSQSVVASLEHGEAIWVADLLQGIRHSQRL